MSLIAFVYRRPDHDDKTFLECVQFPQSSSTAVRKHETPIAGKWPQLCEWIVIWLIILLKCDIFLWNASRDEHSSSSSACLQTSAVCYVVRQCGIKVKGWGDLAGPDRGWVMGLNLCSDPLLMTRHSHMARTGRPQLANLVSVPPCPSPWLCLKAWQAQYGGRKVTKQMWIKCLYNIVYQDAFIWFAAYCCL